MEICLETSQVRQAGDMFETCAGCVLIVLEMCLRREKEDVRRMCMNRVGDVLNSELIFNIIGDQFELSCAEW